MCLAETRARVITMQSRSLFNKAAMAASSARASSEFPIWRKGIEDYASVRKHHAAVAANDFLGTKRRRRRSEENFGFFKGAHVILSATAEIAGTRIVPRHVLPRKSVENIQALGALGDLE